MSTIDDPHQQAMAQRVLHEEDRARRHLVVHLSGAHAYGFPSPDSDLDLKAIHVEQTERLLGLASPPHYPSNHRSAGPTSPRPPEPRRLRAR